MFHYTHYNESSESKSLLRAIESARQMSTNIKMETENGGQLREDFLKEKKVPTWQKTWDGQEAVELFRNSEPGEFDVILMDIMMPVMNGYKATKMIRSLDREEAKEVPIIAMTANAFTEDRIRAKEAGMDEHVAKPVDVELLIKVIHKLVGWWKIWIKDKKILIVDDSNLNRDILKEILGDAYNYLEAENGKQAIQMIGENIGIDLMLLDINMPQMNGFEVWK